MSKILMAIITVSVLSGCAGRDPNMVSSMQSGDRKLVCEDLEEEYSYNHSMAVNKIEANESDDGKDIALGGVGVLLFWPVLFAMDTKNADGKEGNALIDRNDHLISLARKQDCDISDWPPLPNKYN